MLKIKIQYLKLRNVGKVCKTVEITGLPYFN